MAEEEMDVSLATGDSESLKGDKRTNKNNDLEIASQPLPGSHATEVIQTELPDLSQASHDKDHVADDHEKVDLELRTESFEGPNDSSDTDDISNTHATAFEDSPLSKSVDFMFETKYVMLNFMSLLPPEMYRGHISTSPEVESEGNQRFWKPRMHLSKSKSFDTSSHHRKPNLKHIGKLKSMQRHMDSPASEDNLSYRYKKNWKVLDSPGCERFNSDPGSPQTVQELFEKSHSAHEFSSHSSPSVSPRKSFLSPQRQFSDASSSGELSYMSDADDEYEEYSNASSIFSARGISSRDGFLDLRKNVHILPILPSQSEDMDEPDGFLPNPEDNTKATAESGNLGTLPEEVKDDSKDDTERHKELFLQQEISGVDGRGLLKQTADRSKLKLNIPCEPVQLDDILLSLSTELSTEIDEMESEFEEALQSARSRMSHSGIPTPLTPQSEAARVLARIGDEVKEQYGARLAAAVNGLTYEQISSLSYTQFRDIAQSVVMSEVPGWRQVALLMVFGQKIIWGAVQHGNTHFGNVIDYCTQFVAEIAADFIIKQGGWGSVMNFDPSSDTQGSTDFDTSPEMVVDYFTSHDVTQVASEKCIDGTEGEATNNEPGIGDKEDKSMVEDEEQTKTDEPNMVLGQGLTVQTCKTRYASSIGFEYTDEIEGLSEVEIRSDSEQDLNIAFSHSASAERNVDVTENVYVEENVDVTENVNVEENVDVTENGNVRESQEKNDKESDDTECFVEETIDGALNNNHDVTKVPNDLINKNMENVANSNDYDRDSVYVRQATPSATLFDSAVDGLYEDRVMSSNNANKEPVNDIDSREGNSDSERKTVVNCGIVDKAVLNCETREESLKGNEITNNETVGNETIDLLHLNNTTIDNNSVNDSSSKGASAGNVVVAEGKIVNRKCGSNEAFNTTTQMLSGDDEPLLNKGDLKNIGESNVNNNQIKSEVDSYTEDITRSDNNCEYKSDEECIENSERDVTEEHQVPATHRSIGFRVAALAFAVLVVGISVRFATVTR
ncbi:uncharacterized protein LOC123551063 [Mercenaria mercenaria]|uniref:uncharacterized protein LOC123551063 n=1 Tax=Mercenaria mercenaria TaxID=6596 RepID=UPI00234EA977|nr:uncharacterized protein LOC123551063 [Mercenaria mercenaria]XP_045195657.2 uncharacterized protein LOC123551063 [Mercenaria mercenaria]XP_053396518.1 uncharacterized protein LOC123551063 [Mercenaria mercenaria]